MSSHTLATRRFFRTSRHFLQRSYTSTAKPHPLKGANCIITGASRGIGRAIALAFSRQDANLLLLGRNASALQETRSLCHRASPSSLSHSSKTGDVGQREFWTSLDVAKDLPGSGGRLDVFVHAAGITHSSLFVRTTAKLIEEVIQTNLMGAIWGSQIMGKKMMRNRSAAAPATSNADPAAKGVAPVGHILFISSLLATHGGVGSAAYSASKSSLLGLTRSLAAELGPLGIRVNTILPGYIESDMTAAMEAGAREKALARIPMARFGTAEEVADAAVWLAGNAYASNCVVNLDGGLSAV